MYLSPDSAQTDLSMEGAPLIISDRRPLIAHPSADLKHTHEKIYNSSILCIKKYIQNTDMIIKYIVYIPTRKQSSK